MENNNRTILAIALIVLLWSGYSMFFAPQPQPVAPTPENIVEQQQQEKPPVAAKTALVAEVAVPSSLPSNYKEQLIIVSSELFDIQLSTTGATMRAVTLKKFKESNAKDSDLYKLIEFGSANLATFKTSGSEGLSLPSDLPYKLVGPEQKSINVTEGDQTVSFTTTTSNQLTVVKSYTFYPDSYRVDVNVQLINGGTQASNGLFNLSFISAWDEVTANETKDMYTFIGPLSFDGEELFEADTDELEKSSKIYGKSILWSGNVSKYFLSIVSPQDSAQQVQVDKGDGYIQNKFISPYINLEAGQKLSLDYVSYLGPKDYDLLKATGYQFERAKDFGFFRILAQPLLHVLKFFNSFIGNYGFSIILLTICIKLIFWPLTQKSYKSMKGMQKLQPEMQKMREKYGNDKQRLNQEMMSFYKDNKVNPLGGCLPMLIQIPVFFALYQVLLGGIELRHAPFMLWITDLSIKDPYYVTPLIMGVTMFLQQKMTPTNMDPTQAKIMMMMPVVFTFLFLNFPAGLVIYWLVNNVLTILQQYLIRRQPD